MKILPLALTLLNDTARSRLTGMTSTARSLSIVGALAMISAVFFLAALTILLAGQVGVVVACLIMGGIFAALAFGMFMRFNHKRNRKQTEAMERVAIASSADTPVEAGAAMMLQAFIRGFLGPKG